MIPTLPRFIGLAAVSSLVAMSVGCGSVDGSRSADSTSSSPILSTAAPMTTAAPPTTAVLPAAVRPAASATAMPSVVVVGADHRVAVVRDRQATATMDALITPDGRAAVAYAAAGADTELTWHDLANGTTAPPIRIAGELTPTAVDPSGRIVALTSSPAPGRTEIVIAGVDGERFRRTFDVELFPEGFANAWETPNSKLPVGMFVIEYLDGTEDPTGPRTYRVRVVDFATGELSLPYNLRSKGETVDERMTGFARTHVTSERDGLLFTLYRGVNPDESTYAFVHTLGFSNGVWCLDVPNELQLQWEPGSMTLSPDDAKLYVGSANGTLAEYLIEDILNPSRVPAASRVAPLGSAGDHAPAMAASADHLISALDGQISWFDRSTLLLASAVTWPDTVEAIVPTRTDTGAGTVLVAGPTGLSELAPDGQIVTHVDLPADLGLISAIVPID